MLFAFFLTLVGFAAAAATPYKDPSPSCKNPVKRVEWRELKDADKQSYINAVKCLKTKPSRLGLKTSLYDDFAYVHFQYNPSIHFVAAFLPWHRYFTHVYEGALRECGYTGYATYWDWTKDVKKLAKSPIMSSKLGFGGDGSDTRKENINGDIRCVIDGPFSKLRPSYYGVSARVREYIPHCLHRRLADGETPDSINFAKLYNGTNVALVQKKADFATYHDVLEQGPHQAIHSAIAGEMNPATSPNDPIFFLHHTQVDRLWWQWQQANPKTRLRDYSGPTRSLDGQTGKAALTDLLLMDKLAKNITVSDAMSSTSGPFCYIY
ncbi:hypothetical protein NW762_010251 [Fusarium torreyae]|uniref:Tyrosinase copper-binding domain-containing protein n=1 Tax=Fusarium torreyae TaxID=1237075 RepID=A0A9W8RVI0_9HYPO|nr:hypothetical protein NW762_010251 [Fusarium torreyae]